MNVVFGWTGPLLIADQPVPVHGYGRFDNPYCKCEFGAPEMVVRYGKQELCLDFARSQRIVGCG